MSIDRGVVIGIISEVTKKPISELQPNVALGRLSLHSSLALSVLRSTLEKRVGHRLPIISPKTTIAEVIRDCTGIESSSASAVAAVPIRSAQSSLNDFGVGIDIQDATQLPDTAGFRDHPFYSSHFVSRELATAALKSDPRTHLSGIFAAKEAVKKSDPTLLNLRMEDIEIYHEEGRPMVRIHEQTLQNQFQFKLSISHTSQFSAAMVICIRGSV